MRIVKRDGLGAKIDLTSRLVMSNRMDLISAVAHGACTGSVRKEVSEHLIAPARSVLIGVRGKHALHIRPGGGDEHGIADEDQVTARFAENLCRPEHPSHDLNVC